MIHRTINLKSVSLVLLGAASFWIPDIIIHHYYEKHLSLGQLTYLLGWVLPFAVLSCYSVLRLVRRGKDLMLPIAFVMLVGVWLLGPATVTISTSLRSPDSLSMSFGSYLLLLPMTVLCVLYMIPIAFQDASFIGLTIATLALLGITATFERPAWRYCWGSRAMAP